MMLIIYLVVSNQHFVVLIRTTMLMDFLMSPKVVGSTRYSLWLSLLGVLQKTVCGVPLKPNGYGLPHNCP